MQLRSGLQCQTVESMDQVIIPITAPLLQISPSLSVEDSQNDGQYLVTASTLAESAVAARGVLELSSERISESMVGSSVMRESSLSLLLLSYRRI